MDITPQQWSREHLEELIRDIAVLVSCPSVSEPEKAEENRDRRADIAEPYGHGVAAAFQAAAEIAKRYGFTVCRNSHVLRVICKYPDIPGGKEIGIWGHLDVVSPGPGWTKDPWMMEYRDGFLLGRGVKDNKGPAMAALYALRYLKENNVRFPYGLSLYLGASEENGMKDIMAYRKEGGRFPDFSVVADGRWPVAYGEKGQILAELTCRLPENSAIYGLEGGEADNAVCGSARAWLKDRIQINNIPDPVHVSSENGRFCLEAQGNTRHAAFPEGGINALGVLSGVLAELLTGVHRILFQTIERIASGCDGSSLGIACEDSESGPLTCVVTGARLRNDHVLALRINIRYPAVCKEEKLLDQFIKGCESQGFSCQILRSSKPVRTNKNHPLVTALMKGYVRASRKPDVPFILSGGTYAGHLPQAVSFGMGGWPEPGLTELVGPGKGGAHGADEAVLVDNLLHGIEVYIEALAELGKTDL